MMDREILEWIQCPVCNEPLDQADDDFVAEINHAIGKNLVNDTSGRPITTSIDGALVTEDRRRVYPIRGEIPVLVAEQALCWEKSEEG